jgi:hypothetical protein
MQESTFVVIDESQLRQNPDGSITGVVFWIVNNAPFPDNAWNDFIIVVLDWWIRGLIRMLRDHSPVEIMTFMDGPYEIRCTCNDGATAVIDCIDRHGASRVIASANTTIQHLATMMSAVVTRLLRACHQRRFTNADIVSLERSLRQLRQLITRSAL